MTGARGDYIFALLPPGTYTVSFELSGFDRQERSVALAPTQDYPLDIALGLAGIDVFGGRRREPRRCWCKPPRWRPISVRP